ncbi:MAG: hypothetical protein KF690_08165 [Bacteroidetes bacterium]|nr:hypothetical protein [Bacteroidota bacterium]
MVLRALLLILCGLPAWYAPAYAQADDAEEISISELRRYEVYDTTHTRDNWRSYVRTNEKLDILIQRTFPILTDRADTVPINPSGSGSFQLMLVRNFILTRKGHVFQLAPGFNFYRTQFYAGAQKTFPSRKDTTAFERLGLDLFTLSAGLGIMLKREFIPGDTINYRTISMLEFGLTGGIGVGSFYKAQDNAIGSRATVRVPGLDAINRLQLSGYLRLSYKVFVLCAQYTFTPVFLNREFKGFTNLDNIPAGSRYPLFPKLELGIGLLIF